MTDQWQPGKLYAPGDIVQPRITDAIAQSQMDNANFESGDTGWDTGDNWSIVEENPYQGTWAAKFVAGLLMAVGNGDDTDSLAKSTDGVNWVTSDLLDGVYFPGSTEKITVAPSLGKWFVFRRVGGAGFGLVSSNSGASWSVIVPTGDMTGQSCNAIYWAEEIGVLFYGKSDGNIFTSPDGVAWTQRADIGGTVWGFAYSPTLDLTVALTGAASWWSDNDGATWTVGTGDANASIVLVWCSGMSKFIGVRNTDTDVFISTDGKVWTEHVNVLPLGALGQQRGLAYSPLLDRVATVNTTLPIEPAFSDDGINWTLSTTKVNLDWVSITWDARNALFVMCENAGADSSFCTSPNGVTWTERTVSYTGSGVSGWSDIDWGAIAITTRDPLTNDARLAVTPGQQVSAQAFADITGAYSAHVGISWYDSGGTLIKTDWTDNPVTLTGAYRRVSASGFAPDNAATASVQVAVLGAGTVVYFDNVTISHTNPVTISLLLFKATQAAPGFSDSFEPTWPTVVGNTVVDNEVTWEGVPANRVQWQAFPILVSGSSEPTFPAFVGAEVADNTISWVADTRRILDRNCPNTKTVAITASKIFSGDADIIAYSATINPMDWSTENDAGYIPFGLNTYGSQDVSALALYRSNLVAFNSKGFQMWQVDEDPANFAILDAVPIGIPPSADKSLQPVMNDLVFLTEVGIRSMGIAGASTNLQAGDFGKQIDPLVKVKLAAGEVPISLYYPGAGQYWLIFGAEAFVLTMNGGKSDMSWSRYVFPSDIDDWTILNEDLLLRSGDKIWRLDDAAERDDQVGDPANSGTAFVGRIWWPYLDFGRFGGDKQMIGFDLVATGAVTVTFGYDQTNDAIATAAYVLAAGDTLPGTIVPMPITGPSFQLRLEFSADQNVPWEWSGAILYVEDIGT